METDSLKYLQGLTRQFVEARDWQSFQSPKNLSMGMIVEAGELVEHFQWLTEEQSRSIDSAKKAEVADEIADVLVFLLRLADELNIDLGAWTEQKIFRNGEKYPVDQCSAGPDPIKRGR